MKTRILLRLVVPAIAAMLALTSRADITYQGRLAESGAPVTTPHDFRFRLYDHATESGPAHQIGPQEARPATVLDNGVFTVSLNFGAGAFPGADRWLEVEVSSAGANTWTIITPRHLITAAPYAIRATSAATADAATTATTANAVTAGAVNNAALASGAVDSAKLADGTIAANDLSPTLLNSTFWRLLGNAGTTPGTHFIGTADNQPLAFRVNNAEAARIRTNGFVGIGTALPGTSLEVIGGIRAKGGPPGANAENNAGYAFSGVGGGDTDSGMFSSADGQLEFYSNSGERMRIHSNGNVGIGKTDPQAPLDVAGEVRADVFNGNHVGNGSGLTGLDAAALASGTVSDARLSTAVSLLGQSIESVEIADGTVQAADVNPASFNTTFWRAGGNAGTTPSTHFLGTTDNQAVVFRANNAEVMRVVPGGKVGIGTTAPAKALQVGDLSATSEGMIRLVSREGGASRTWDIGAPKADPNATGYSFVVDDPATGTGPELMVKYGTGYVGIGTINPQAALHVAGTAQVDSALNFGASTRQMINLYSTLFGIGVQDYRLYFRTGPPGFNNGFEWFSGGSHTAAAGQPGLGGIQLMELTESGLTVKAPVKAEGGLVIENRTSDPASPANGQIWLRTDL